MAQSQMVRERLLATLSRFFAAVALILAAVGLYGVLNYTVLERRRELGIRIALGATGSDIAVRITFRALAMIVVGAAIGIALGIASEQAIAALLYQVKATDPDVLAAALITMLGAALVAAFPPVLRAVRIDPTLLLRSD